MYSDQVTQKQVQIIRYIQQNENEMNKFFKDMKFKAKQFKQNSQANKQSHNNNNDNNNTKKQQPQQQKPKTPNFHLNYRGEKIFSVQTLRKNYEQAIFGTKWWQLPYGRRNILGKIQFWLGASFIFTYMYGSYHMRQKKIEKLSFKFYRNTYGLFALASIVYVFTESLLFQPYCDINSYHYQTNDNRQIARDIKKQLRQISK